MKIGLITHYMPPHQGGIERVAETLWTAYTSHGYEVRWVASRDPADAPAREGERIRVPCWNGLERRLQVPLPLWGPAAWREVARLAHWADVLHAHDCLYPGSVGAVLWGRYTGTPVLLSQHAGLREFGSPALSFLARAAYRTLGRWVLRRASRLVFVTPAAEKLTASLLGGYPAHACVIQNGLDLSRFRPATAAERGAVRARLGLPGEGPIVLFIGRLVEQKGVDLLAEVIRRLPSVHFLVVGDGPSASVVPREAHATWRRSVDPNDIHECYHACNCLVLPSYGEGLPLVVQEAAACGLAILISDGETYSGPLLEQQACVSAPRTVEAMSNRLQEIVSGHMPWLGERARGYAEAHWSLGAMTAKYASLLEQMDRERVARARGAIQETT